MLVVTSVRSSTLPHLFPDLNPISLLGTILHAPPPTWFTDCISCIKCCKLYIGETGWRLTDRVAEHLRSVRNNNVGKPVSRYFNAANHSISGSLCQKFVPFYPFLKQCKSVAPVSIFETFAKYVDTKVQATPEALMKTRRCFGGTFLSITNKNHQRTCFLCPISQNNFSGIISTKTRHFAS